MLRYVLRPALPIVVLAALVFIAGCSTISSVINSISMDETADDATLDTTPAARKSSVIHTEKANYKPLGTNSHGYQEYKRLKDGATVVMIDGGYFLQHSYQYCPPDNDEEGEQLFVPSFLMDKTEVTNAHVAGFIAQHKALLVFKDDALFAADATTPWAITHPWGLKITEDGAETQPGYERHPAVGISGFLCLAYCQWLGGDLPRGYEHEKASAGPAGQFYPWGDVTMKPDSTRVNFFLSGPKHTMPVGSYPAGASPYGLLDLSGNVYERAYWSDNPEQATEEAIKADERLGHPSRIKGGSWLSPHWWNLRSVCQCGQPLHAMEGSVGFRVVVRDEEAIKAFFYPEKARLRMMTNTAEAYQEASDRNVPIFLYLGYETCGQCDRVRAELFEDANFIEYCNEHMIVLVGNNPRYEGGNPPLPVDAEGYSVCFPGLKQDDLYEVYGDFSWNRDEDLIPLEVEEFIVSPGLFVLNPHRKLITKPKESLLIPERAFKGYKTGGGVDHYIQLFKNAQAMLGDGQSYTDYLANKTPPETTWRPPGEK